MKTYLGNMHPSSGNVRVVWPDILLSWLVKLNTPLDNVTGCSRDETFLEVNCISHLNQENTWKSAKI